MRYRAKPSGHLYNVEIRGVGDPLLLLHGFSGAITTWKPVAPRLEYEFKLIAFDLLGHGASDAPAAIPGYRMASAAADLVDLLDQLNLTRAHLLGYSMGGRLALYLALRYPERFRSLILESASPGLADVAAREERRRQDADLADKIEARGIDWFVDYWAGLPLWRTQNQDLLSLQRGQRLSNNAKGLANSLRGSGTGAQPNLWRRLPALNRPSLLLVGERDEKFRRINRAMAAAMPQATLSVIPGAGHNTHLEKPDAFCLALLSFLRRL